MSAGPNIIELRSATGGSFIEAQQLENGMCHLSVGSHSLHVIDQVMSVDALAAAMSVCKDVGWRIILQRYAASNRGAPSTFLDEDSKPAQDRGRMV